MTWEDLTIDTIPEIDGAGELANAFIEHADLSQPGVRDILFILLLVATLEGSIRGTVKGVNELYAKIRGISLSDKELDELYREQFEKRYDDLVNDVRVMQKRSLFTVVKKEEE